MDDSIETLANSHYTKATDSRQLLAVDRNGVNFYSLKRCGELLFPDIPIGSVKRWLCVLGKKQSKASSEERSYLAEHDLPGCRHLVSERDVNAIIDYAVKHGRNVSSLTSKTTVVVNSSENRAEHGMVTDVGQGRAGSSNFSAELDLSSDLEDILHEESLVVNSSENRAENGMVTNVGQGQAGSSNFSAEFDLSSELEDILHEESLSCGEDDAEEGATVGRDLFDSAAVSSGLIGNSELTEQLAVVHETVGKTPCENLSSQDDNATASAAAETTAVTASITSSNTCVGAGISKARPKSLGRLPEDVFDETLKRAMCDLEQFYSAIVQPLRRGKHFSASTLHKFLERVSCFLNFCRIKYPERCFDFDLIDDVDLVQIYLDYLLQERKLSISTAVRTLSALINLSRFVHREEANVDMCPGLIRLGNMQRQLLKEENGYRLVVKAGLSGKPRDDLMYSHILETLRKLREKFETFSVGVRRTRILHDFVMIAIYVTCMCGRGKEIRTLQIFEESAESQEYRFNWKDKCNVLVLSVDGQFTLYENDFKTIASYGPSKMLLDEPQWLVSFMKLYIADRASLLDGKSHMHMFFGVNGEPFSSSSLSLYMAKVFEREVNVRAGTTKLRHALVTHILSLPDSDSLKLRESLAHLMRHSLKHQSSTYNDASRREKTAMSRELLNRSVEKGTFSEDTTAKMHETNIVPATVGDICAVLDSVSTSPEDAKFFLGRIVRLTDNLQEALLMEFRAMEEGEPNIYRARVDSCWWEKVDSLIFPVDIVYEKSKKVYELRSSAADIYRTVFPPL